MTANQLTTISVEQQLLSKQAIQLPIRERLELLLNAKEYPIVRKKSSAKNQVKEMVDLYNLYCFMLTEYFPDEKAEENCAMLTMAVAQEFPETMSTAKLAEAFKMLKDYEELENRITAIQMLFEKYRENFPDLYEMYNLEDIVEMRISDMIYTSRKLRNGNPLWVRDVLRRWELS